METNATPTASGDIAATTSSAETSPVSHTDSTGSAAPAIQATDANPITDNTASGEPPKERWSDILENTRKKEREAALNEWRQQYGWAESVPREQLEQMATFYGSYQDNPAEWLEKAYQEALTHPVHGVSVKSRVGKMLASLKAQHAQAEAPLPEIEPDIPVLDTNGNVVNHAYSAKAMKEIVKREIQAALGKEVAPLKEDLESRRTAAQKAEEKQQSEAIADQHIAYVKGLPWFDEYKADIKAAFDANKGISLFDAYTHVLKTKIHPAIGQKSEAKVLSDLQQKANAQTVHAGAGAVSAPPKFKNFAESYAYYEQHPEEAQALVNRT